MLIPVVVYDAVHIAILIVSVGVSLYSIREFWRNRGTALGGLWIIFSLASLTIAIISAIFVLGMITGFLAQIHHESEMTALAALNASVLYSAFLLKKFQKNIRVC